MLNLKILSSEINASNTTPNTVSSASLVRIVNVDPSNSAVIQVASNTGSVLATFTLGQHGTNFARELVVKKPTDTIQILGAYTSTSFIRMSAVAK